MPTISQHFSTPFYLFSPSLSAQPLARTSLESLLSVAELALLWHGSGHSGSWSPCCEVSMAFWGPPQPYGPHSSCLLQCHPGDPANQGSTSRTSPLFPLPSFPGELEGGFRLCLPVSSSSHGCASTGPIFLPAACHPPLLCQKLAAPCKLPAELFVWALPNLSQSRWIGLSWTIQVLGLC